MSPYFCKAEVNIPDGYIAFSNIYHASGVNFTDIGKYYVTGNQFVVESDGHFINDSTVYANILLVPDNWNV